MTICYNFIVDLIHAIAHSSCGLIERYLDAFDRVLLALSTEGKVISNEKTARGASKEDLLLAENMKLREDNAEKAETIKHYQEIYYDMTIQRDVEKKSCIQLKTQNKSQEQNLKIKENDLMELTMEYHLVSSQLTYERRTQSNLHQKVESIDEELKGIKQELSITKAELTTTKNKQQTTKGTETHSEKRLPVWKSDIIPNIVLCSFWLGYKFVDGIKIGTKEIKNLSAIIKNKTNCKAIDLAIDQILWKWYKFWRSNTDLQSISVKEISCSPTSAG